MIATNEDVDREEAIVGTLFAERYHLEELIGRGMMGVVYRARQAGVARDLAVKVLRRKHWGTTAARRFEREAEIISRLKNPHTVQLFDRGTTKDGDMYIVTDYLHGATLGAVLDSSRLPLVRVLAIAEQICGSLEEAHAMGIVHRDLKPDNIFLLDGRSDDFIKVLDFGIARLLSGSRVTREGMVIGTPMYMSPEQATADPVDARSDIYSVGAMLYHMLAGAPPFARPTPLETLLAHVKEEPPRVTRTADLGEEDSIELEVEDLVFEMMSKLRLERPQTIKEVGERISALYARALRRG